ncbi:MAG: hypothetical protein QOH25_3868 [Acidobacteriota bacterium]|nr:hypothetical protein [Acidobacteriota bacterium]
MHWDIILRRMSLGRCVPFLGAAVNVRSRDENYPYAGLPLADKVALDLINRLMALDAKELKDLAEVKYHDSFKKYGREDLLRLTLHNLARVALHVEVETNFDFGHLLDLLRTSLSDDCEPSKLLKTIASIKTLELIVTTNYDRLMESALEKVHRTYESVVQPIDGFKGKAQKEIKERLSQALTKTKRLILYKIHGTFIDAPSLHSGEKLKDSQAEVIKGQVDKIKLPTTINKPPRIIVTEDDYIKFLTIIGIKDVGVPALISQIIADSTLLFLGYSLEDWDFRTIYKGIHETLPHPDRRTSFAIQKDPPPFWVDFWRSKGVIIYDLDVYKFADELKRRCQEKGIYRETWSVDEGGR